MCNLCLNMSLMCLMVDFLIELVNDIFRKGLNMFLVSINMNCFNFSPSKIFILVFVSFFHFSIFGPSHLNLMLSDDIYKDLNKIHKIFIMIINKYHLQ